MHAYMCMYMYVCLYLCMCVCVCACACVCVCVYVCTYACMHVCMLYACMCVYACRVREESILLLQKGVVWDGFLSCYYEVTSTKMLLLLTFLGLYEHHKTTHPCCCIITLHCALLWGYRGLCDLWNKLPTTVYKISYLFISTYKKINELQEIHFSLVGTRGIVAITINQS